MKTKIFLYILPLLILSLIIATKQNKSTQPKSWTLAKIKSGNQFTVKKGIRTKTIDLCGVLPTANTQNYLVRLINLVVWQFCFEE